MRGAKVIAMRVLAKVVTMWSRVGEVGDIER
jgi:hypothetical protein